MQCIYVLHSDWSRGFNFETSTFGRFEKLWQQRGVFLVRPYTCLRQHTRFWQHVQCHRRCFWLNTVIISWYVKVLVGKYLFLLVKEFVFWYLFKAILLFHDTTGLVGLKSNKKQSQLWLFGGFLSTRPIASGMREMVHVCGLQTPLQRYILTICMCNSVVLDTTGLVGAQTRKKNSHSFGYLVASCRQDL